MSVSTAFLSSPKLRAVIHVSTNRRRTVSSALMTSNQDFCELQSFVLLLFVESKARTSPGIFVINLFHSLKSEKMRIPQVSGT